MRAERKRVIDLIKNQTDTSISSLRQLSLALRRQQSADTALLYSLIRSVEKKIDSSLGKKDTIKLAHSTLVDVELESLAKKLLPLLEKKTESDLSSALRRKRLRQKNWLLANNKVLTDTVTHGDSLRTIYTIKLKRRADFFGYHPSWSNSKYRNYKFKLISTLAFYAYHLNGKTGDALSTNGWDTSEVIDAAQREGCKVALVVLCKNADTAATFLKNTTAQKKLGQNLVQMLATRNANGVNVLFESTNGIKKVLFTRFISQLRKTLKAADPDYELSVTIPADSSSAFDVSALDTLADKIVVDFTRLSKRPGPLAPLDGGGNSIKTVLKHLLDDKGILPEKIVACLPYRGVLKEHDLPPRHRYITYDTIQLNYPEFLPVYADSSTAYITVKYDDTDTLETIWFDNEITLNKKLNYILDNEVGGVGVWALGYDNGNNALWDLLLDKLFTIDTVSTRDSMWLQKPRGFWASIRHEFALYKLIFNEPCKVDTSDLKADDLVGVMTPLLVLLVIIVTIFYVYMLRFEGDSWKWKKTVLRVLIVLIVTTIIFLFLYVYLNDSISLIGLSKDHGHCNSLPFKYVLMLVGVGFLLGLAVMRFLIMPLMRNDEEP